MKIFHMAICGVLMAFSLAACDEPNPYYLGPAGQPGEDANGFDQDGGAADGAFISTNDDARRDAAQLFPDAQAGDAAAACSAAICEANFGKRACGPWTCVGGACQVNCPNCQDKDRDGFGQGAGCAGPDCDDDDPRLRADVTARACYEGPAATSGKGNCRSGVAACSAGVWTDCQGQQLPLGESCNAEDDDCNGKIDDLPALRCGLGVCANQANACNAIEAALCTPKPTAVAVDNCGGGDEDCDGVIDEDCTKCAHVSAKGDNNADGSIDKPFRSIQAAIDWAAADAARPKLVCVAGASTCASVAPATLTRFTEGDTKSLVMKNGVSVVGGYESTTWKLCPQTLGGVVPRNAPILQTHTPEGVLFDETITSPTSLSGVVIERNPADKVSAAITIRGAKGASVLNVKIPPLKGAESTVGVDISAKAEALVARSDLDVGEGSQKAIGVRVKDATAAILDNCGAFDDQGRCKAICALGTPSVTAGSTENKGGETHAVLLDNAVAAVVSNNALCAGSGKDSAGVKIVGPSPNTIISGNVVRATGGTAVAAGVWFADCAGHRPWVVGNPSVAAIAGGDATKVAGVLSEGACQPRIDGNGLVSGSGNTAKSVSGIQCGNDDALPNGCQIVGNLQIRAGGLANAELGVGIRCLSGSCARISGNKLIDGGRGKRTFGVWLDESDTRVDANKIQGGCGDTSSTGVLAIDSAARIDNNIVFGAVCDPKASVDQPTGVSIVIGQTRRAFELHSNTISVAAVDKDECRGSALVFSTRPDTVGGTTGFVRNNIFSNPTCRGTLVEERDPTAHARVFENNLFDQDDDPPLFLANGKDLLSLSEVNQTTLLSLRRNNHEGDAKFVKWPVDLHLKDDSAAIGKGTPAGAPTGDYDGRPRDTKPDMGAFEN